MIQISLEVVDAVELLEFTSIQCAEACANRPAQDFQLGGILRFALLDEAQAFA
jgi:hypothetical protein